MKLSNRPLDHGFGLCSDAPVQTAARDVDRDPWIRWMTWGAMFLASTIPDIVYRQFSAPTPLWLPASQVVLLIAAAMASFASVRLKNLGGLLLALAAFRLGWSILTPAAQSTSVFQSATRDLNWSQFWLALRLVPISGGLLMLVTLIGSGLTRDDLFLRIGKLNALSRPEPVPFFYRPVSWRSLGIAVLIIFGIALPLVLLATLPLDFTRSRLIWRFLPYGIVTAAVNAANEEFQFRSILLARLRRLVSDRDAVLMTATLFGLGHYYGQPSGPLGVIMAGIAGWVWAKSMIETRGFFWAWSTHTVQDIVIFIFLTMSIAT